MCEGRLPLEAQPIAATQAQPIAATQAQPIAAMEAQPIAATVSAALPSLSSNSVELEADRSLRD